MDEEMEENFEEEEDGFLPVKIDLDYEFDASRFFDFTRQESPIEARGAELWFDRAGSYPPSPFIAKLKLGIDVLKEDEPSNSLKSDDMDDGISTSTHSDTGMVLESSVFNEKFRGLKFYNHMEKDIPKSNTKSTPKTALARGSTLMKPTASQLAKQIKPPGGHGSNRFQKPFLKNSDRSLGNLSSVGIQAAKRQKLDGGHSLKVVAEKNEQHNLIHKAPKKGGTIDCNFVHGKLKITIPKEPDLETAHRAHRIRTIRDKSSLDVKEQVKPTSYRFKARPLNRKILEGPSLPLLKKTTPRLPEFREFHLKTSERAVHQSSAASSSIPPRDKSDKVVHIFNAGSETKNGLTNSKRPNTVDTSNQEGVLTHNFKARPLNKKIFASKGDIGVFWNIKREPTIPMEFNFPTARRFQHNPPDPVELFNKLSLTTELPHNNVSQPRLRRPSRIPSKGSKENSADYLQHENIVKTINTVRDKTQMCEIKHT